MTCDSNDNYSFTIDENADCMQKLFTIITRYSQDETATS